MIDYTNLPEPQEAALLPVRELRRLAGVAMELLPGKLKDFIYRHPSGLEVGRMAKQFYDVPSKAYRSFAHSYAPSLTDIAREHLLTVPMTTAAGHSPFRVELGPKAWGLAMEWSKKSDTPIDHIVKVMAHELGHAGKSMSGNYGNALEFGFPGLSIKPGYLDYLARYKNSYPDVEKALRDEVFADYVGQLNLENITVDPRAFESGLRAAFPLLNRPRSMSVLDELSRYGEAIDPSHFPVPR